MMRKQFTEAVTVILVLTVVLTACSPQATDTPIPKPTATRVPTDSPAPTQTVVPVEPTLSPRPVSSPSPEPTVTPIPCEEGDICLTAHPAPVPVDGTVTLEWNAPAALRVAMSWWSKQGKTIVHSDLLPSGSMSLAMADVDIGFGRARVYLRAEYADGESESESLDIPVQARHAITAFTVSPPTVNPGDTVTLSWEVAGEVQEVGITILDEHGLLTLDGFRDLAASGSVNVTVPTSRRNSMGFSLAASDAHGAWDSTLVYAKIACPDVWFFPNPPHECCWPADWTKMAVQHFEHGLMIWSEWGDRIRVFYGDSEDVHLRYWSRHDNEWSEDMPAGDPTITPPPGYYQPVRGFGKLWREGSHDFTPIRELLGWAIEPEFAIERGAVQCDTRPKYSRCYVGDPLGVVYVEGPEWSGWYEWSGPDAIP